MWASRIPGLVVLLALLGCPREDTGEVPPDAGTAATTHTGTISIQDRRLLGASHLGHGVSVLVDMSTAPRAPDHDDEPGRITGCKVWVYDIESDPPPRSAGDVGTLAIEGTSANLGPGCVFQDGAGYVCPTATGQGEVVLEHAAAGTGAPPNTARISIGGAAFGPDDSGRYLHLRGAPGASGSFPIVSVTSATEVRVAKAPGTNPAPSAGTYQVLAGAGPVPGTPADEAPGDPLRDTDQVRVRITPGNDSPFHFPETTVAAIGGAFTPDTATLGLLDHVPLDGRAFRLGCAGEGGHCGTAEFTIIQLQTTDGPTAGLSPFVLPPAKRRQVVLTCIQPGVSGFVDIPAEASALLARAHAASPITRIRTALMRNGAVLTKNPTPPDNTVRVVAGHQLIGFTNP
ncbi:hypothetical protein JRI60_23900 [Archangium violaceum]|uniref:hypothetical protein n=1 Tax=Archangium violaceum TaxID=83451 RepID=UPI0019502E77|nr:hypothetical protein [Archangium violaceum]QRO01843.1 hypothetical protein JRI60_23900 [Archangium violaceum]